MGRNLTVTTPAGRKVSQMAILEDVDCTVYARVLLATCGVCMNTRKEVGLVFKIMPLQ